jgi:hypothetical protein
MRDVSRSPALAATILVIAAMTVSACTSTENTVHTTEVEKVAAEARADIDELAGLVGTDPEVLQDVIGDCIPGQDNSGLTLDYAVRVQITDGAYARLESEIADRFAAEGWTVKHDTSSNRVRFQRGSATIGATVFAERGFAVASGSGGCVG